MGMDLSGKGGDFRFSNANWRDVLMLANDQGWKSAGTEPPEFTFFREDGTVDEEKSEAYRQAYEDWDATNYYTNDFQWVTDEDAANIADALERALEGNEVLNTDYLREFIVFCRAGGFSIA